MMYMYECYLSGWYRKSFNLPVDWKNGATWVHFDGCFQVCDIFLNGQFLLRHTSGYLGFDIRLDQVAPDLLRVGSAAPNVLSVRINTKKT